MEEDEYAPGSEVLDATHHLAMPLSTEERANIPLQDGQFGLVTEVFHVT